VGESWLPPLRLTELEGRCCLSLDGVALGSGSTLQDAADDLVRAALDVARSVRSAGVAAGSTDLPRLDGRLVELMHHLCLIAEQGGDVRERLFGGG
jgi:hypothetical protein